MPDTSWSDCADAFLHSFSAMKKNLDDVWNKWSESSVSITDLWTMFNHDEVGNRNNVVYYSVFKRPVFLCDLAKTWTQLVYSIKLSMAIFKLWAFSDIEQNVKCLNVKMINNKHIILEPLVESQMSLLFKRWTFLAIIKKWYICISSSITAIKSCPEDLDESLGEEFVQLFSKYRKCLSHLFVTHDYQLLIFKTEND